MTDPAPRVPLTQAEREARTRGINDLVEIFGQGVKRDGGNMRLVSLDVEQGRLSVELSGSCASCALSTRTLHGNFEKAARQLFPWITEVEGSVDTSIPLSQSRSLGRGAWVDAGL